MRQQKAWNHLEQRWGKGVADALWEGKWVTVAAKNGMQYQVTVENGRWVRLRNLTLRRYYCCHISALYPYADQALALLEYIRVAPEIIEQEANWEGSF